MLQVLDVETLDTGEIRLTLPGDLYAYGDSLEDALLAAAIDAAPEQFGLEDEDVVE